jgi:serine/threonine protein kinase
VCVVCAGTNNGGHDDGRCSPYLLLLIHSLLCLRLLLLLLLLLFSHLTSILLLCLFSKKPDNIGFDAEDTLKIFDFGLAKELKEDEHDGHGLYRMTGFTGAIRYMAPEVGLRKPYNLKADVYSWSMLMWYIMALEPPMGMYTPNMFIDRVFRKGYRPAVKAKWPEKLGELMKACWSESIDERPSFQTIMMTLRKEAQDLDPDVMSFLQNDAASSKSGLSSRRS